jgi:L-lactate dehydrogenase complex protein LldG
MSSAFEQARATMLLKIKQALIQKTPVPFVHNGNENFIQPQYDALVNIFETVFTSLQGKFFFANTEAEKIERLQKICLENNFTKIYCPAQDIVELCKRCNFMFSPYHSLADCDVSITHCEYLVARTGSMLLSSGTPNGRTSSVYAPVHICMATQEQFVYDIDDAIIKLQEKYNQQLPSFISLASGPSRTADIEKTLVVGVHGPKEVYCLVS